MKEGEEEEEGCLITLAVGRSTPPFDFEKSVCSHGLFMMAPNLWLPSAKMLRRPLRLADSTTTVTARITHHAPSSSLHIWVLGPHSLSLEDQGAIKAQVARMLRLSEDEDRKISEFHKIHHVAKERGFGRVFRSPTLFEDMVKCILLCNCHWSRTLSMARALCELQFELKGAPSGWSTDEAAAYVNQTSLEVDQFSPKTPTPRKPKRKRGNQRKIVTNLMDKLVKDVDGLPGDMNLSDHIHLSTAAKKAEPNVLYPVKEDSDDINSSSQLSIDNATAGWSSVLPQLQGGRTCVTYRIGDFPSPQELANFDENYLVKRCGLGYRAKRILELAKSIVEQRLQLQQLQDKAKISNYDELTQQLLDIQGFGPFTCANVLMCMGFYQRIPTDSETVRHLKQYHGISGCNIHNAHGYVEKIYEKYAPFQFLAYWLELWGFYEVRFGKTSEMNHSSYQLITASNMRRKSRKRI